MATLVNIDIQDSATPYIQRLMRTLTPVGLDKTIGTDLAEMTRSHLRALDEARPNRIGGKRSHYYGQAARNTRMYLTPGNIRIAIQQIGISLHYFGGTVVPVTKKWLTIPVTSESYGRRAGEFSGLRFVMLKGDDKAGLFDRSKTMQYLLVKKTKHNADTTVVPNEQALRGQVDVTMKRILRLMRGGEA